MINSKRIRLLVTIALTLSIVAVALVAKETRAQQQSSYMPVVEEPFEVVRARDKAAKARVMADHFKILEQRYDLGRHVDDSECMTLCKPIPVGPTAKLKNGLTLDQPGRMSLEGNRTETLFPYLPLRQCQ